MQKKQFIEYVRESLRKKNIELRLVNATDLDRKYAGWFDSEQRQLVIAARHKNFAAILVHEYCHFLQWVDNPLRWNRFTNDVAVFFDWLDSEQPVSRKIIDAKHAVQTLEHDCERRAIRLIKKLKLELGIRSYAQKANAYLLSYHLTATFHRWPNKKSLYRKRVEKLMPATLLPLAKIKNESYPTDAMLREMKKCFK